MKFGQLPVGTRFDYEGVQYVKTGPLVAAPEDGGAQRFLGRYADVRVLVSAPPAGVNAGGDWPSAFDALYAECIAAIDALGAGDPTAVARAKQQLEAARQRLVSGVAGKP